MKHAENNDMDLLIRSLAQREGGSSIRSNEVTGDQAGRAHLDADELNSYAEGTLPALTRARYTTHLADCSSCRGIVSQLALSSGAGVPKRAVEAQTSLGFREKLRVLFSPAVLRYAVPALALFAVIAVSLVALREQPLGGLTARRSSSTATQETDDLSSQPAPATDSQAAATRSDESRDASAQKAKPTYSRQQAAVSEEGKPEASVTAADQNRAASGNTAGAASQPAFAPEPAAAPAPTPEAKRSEAESADAARRPAEKTAEKREAPARDERDDRQRRNEEAAPTAGEDKESGAYSKSKDATQPVKRVGTLRAGQGLRRSDEKKADDDGAEIRTVSGRRFRKQENAWIDTAYQSSSSTTLVTRGSEQYRALVADEPGIRTIAEQLSGEVVVVWKGRAYRIR